MTFRTSVFTVLAALTLSAAAFAQATPDGASTPAPAATTWVSHQGTYAQTHAHNCSVYPLGTGLFPMFFLDRSGALLSLEGADTTPIGVKLQVDANAALDSGFPDPSEEVVRTLMNQIYAGGETLRISREKIVAGKLETVVDAFPLAGAVDEFQKCAGWVLGK
jgi:hypothetical protein